jgi:hypothetical protein
VSHDHGHAQSGGLEWADLMPDINRAQDPGNMIWQPVERRTGAVKGAVDWAFTVGDRGSSGCSTGWTEITPCTIPSTSTAPAGSSSSAGRHTGDEPGVKGHRLLPAGATADMLLDVSNPGLWMAHCHVAEHTGSGMMVQLQRRTPPGAGPMTAETRGPWLAALVIGGGQAGRRPQEVQRPAHASTKH